MCNHRIVRRTGGTAIAYYNNSVASPMQQWSYSGPSATVGTVMVPGGTWFADLDGDGKTEITGLRPNGEILAWRNVRGFASSSRGGAVLGSRAFRAPNRWRSATG